MSVLELYNMHKGKSVNQRFVNAQNNIQSKEELDMPTLHESIQATYKEQKEKADKIIFAAMVANRNFMLEKGRIFPEKSRKELGFNQSGDSDKADTACENTITNNLFKDLMSYEGSAIDNIKDAYRWFGIIQAKIKCELGVEYEKMLASLPDERDKNDDFLNGKDNIRIKEKKAAYLAYTGWSKASGLDIQIKDLVSEFKYYIRENGGYDDFIKDCSAVDGLTTFGDFVKKLDIDNDTIDDIYKEYNADSGTSLYTAVKNRLFNEKKALGEHNPEVRDEEIEDRVEEMADKFFRSSFERQGREAFLNNCTLREKKLFEEGDSLRKRNEELKEIRKWMEDKETGHKLLSVVSKTNLSNCLIEDKKRLSGGKEIGFYKLNGISELYNNHIEINRDYVGMAIHYMEKTGRGESRFGWHKNNSETYEKMLRAIKDYKLMCDGRSGGKALSARKEMIKCCLSYINGKEKVRDTWFGKERFDMAMLVLSKNMKKDDFNALLNRINTKRHAVEGNENYISRDTIALNEDKKVSEYKAEESSEIEKKQKSTYENRTIIADKYKKKVDFIDHLYSKNPAAEDISEFLDEEDIKKLTVIEDKLPAIEPAGAGDELSGKDFAAIAYGAAFSPETLKLGGRFSDLTEEENLLYQGDSYTSDLMSIGSKAFFSEADIAKIDYGRREAEAAMKEYGVGRKDRLARNLAYGLRHIIDRTRTNFDLDEKCIPNSEMGRRMTDMIIHDPELKKLVTAYGVKSSEIAYIRSYNTVMNIYNNGVSAFNKLKMAAKYNNEYTEDAKLSMAEDIIAMEVVSRCIYAAGGTVSANKEYSDKDAKYEFDKNKKLLRYIIDNGYEDKEKYYRMQEKRQHILEAQKLNAANKYADPAYIVKKLEIAGQENKLKTRVRDIVKSKGLHKLPAEELYNRLNNSNTIRRYTRELIDEHYAQNKYKPEKESAPKEIKIPTVNSGKRTPRIGEIKNGRITKYIH